MARLIAKSKEAGVLPEDYAEELVEDALALQQQAARLTFAEIMAPVRKSGDQVNNADLLAMVDHARTDHHHKTVRTKKR